MPGHGAVRRLVFIYAVRRDEDGGHHGERAVCRGDHVAHHVAVVVLARPDEPAFRADRARHRVVDQRIQIVYSRALERRAVFRFVQLGKDIFEPMVVRLGNGILGGKPERQADGERVPKAGAGELFDGFVRVVHAHDHAVPRKVEDGAAHFFSVRIGEHELRLSRSRARVRGFIEIAVRMTGNDDRLFPGGDIGHDALRQHGRAENRSVQERADGPVRALPHLF